MDASSRQSMLDMFVYETVQLIEQLEDLLIGSEQTGRLSAADINEVFRIMHTIKGSSAMMMYDQVAALAHALEDLFDLLRNQPELELDTAQLTDHVLHSADFIKAEVAKAQASLELDGQAGDLISQVKAFQAGLMTAEEPVAVAAGQPGLDGKQVADQEKAADDTEEKTVRAIRMIDLGDQTPACYEARLTFTEGCQMENMHAFTVVHNLKDLTVDLWHVPADILENEASAEVIRKDGFTLYFTSFNPQDDLYAQLDQTLFLENLQFQSLPQLPPHLLAESENIDTDDEPSASVPLQPAADTATAGTENALRTGGPVQESNERASSLRTASVISVHISKLDTLMDLVGELVISEAMVTHNPELDGLPLDGFYKAARQLNKLTNELQDIVMSIRMVPVAATFQKMQRIVRDMSRKLGKTVHLEILGEQTEVDKSIIDRLADPLMHLIRNGLDHGIENPQERREAGKPEQGTILLEARHAGSDVWITVRDDGRGIDAQQILAKARSKGLLDRPEQEYSEKELLSLIMLPGFSTKEAVSEFSGRGVGMDVVRENIEKIGGSVSIDSFPGQGTTFMIRIPLTLAIIDGMLLSVGQARYILPITAIRESFRPQAEQIITDSENNEMLMIRGQCVQVKRLHRQFAVKTEVEDLASGILVVVEDDDQTVCLFADALLGEQQAVVKPLPAYIRKSPGLAGCTILGDGSISLILDVGGLLNIQAG